MMLSFYESTMENVDLVNDILGNSWLRVATFDSNWNVIDVVNNIFRLVSDVFRIGFPMYLQLANEALRLNGLPVLSAYSLLGDGAFHLEWAEYVGRRTGVLLGTVRQHLMHHFLLYRNYLHFLYVNYPEIFVFFISFSLPLFILPMSENHLFMTEILEPYDRFFRVFGTYIYMSNDLGEYNIGDIHIPSRTNVDPYDLSLYSNTEEGLWSNTNFVVQDWTEASLLDEFGAGSDRSLVHYIGMNINTINGLFKNVFLKKKK